MTPRSVYLKVSFACKKGYGSATGNQHPPPERSDTMKQETMNIRDMCAEYDVTPRTLRFYEAKELLFPIREGQRRLFTKRDRARLKLILRGKRFGFSLEEIRQLLDLYHMDDSQHTQLSTTYEFAKRHLDAMERQRAELDEAIAELKEQMVWGASRLAELAKKNETAA
jgi:DNA-binding transcriptional MerR regulator